MKNKSKEYKEFIKDVYATTETKTAQDIIELFKELTKNLFKEALDVELTNLLGYDRYEHTEAIKNNYRNGSYNKTLKQIQEKWKLKFQETETVYLNQILSKNINVMLMVLMKKL